TTVQSSGFLAGNRENLAVSRRMPSTGLEVDAFEPARQILLQLYALNDAGLSPRRTDRIRRETLFFLLEGGEEQKWAWDRRHSEAARAAHRAALEERRRFPGQVEVRYDHAIPITLLWSGLRDACRSTDTLRAFVQRYVQGVVILKEEDIRLTAA